MPSSSSEALGESREVLIEPPLPAPAAEFAEEVDLWWGSCAPLALVPELVFGLVLTALVLAETKLGQKSHEVIEICLPDQWRVYQMFIAQLWRVYARACRRLGRAGVPQ